MIKKILISLCLLFLDRVAIANQTVPNWVFVGTNISESSIYIDVNNIISKSKNIKQYWTKINFTKQEPCQVSKVRPKNTESNKIRQK